MQFCYSKTVCHLQKNVNTVGASVMFEIEMRQFICDTNWMKRNPLSVSQVFSNAGYADVNIVS